MNIPLNIDWQQILLHWFNLAILIAGLYFLLYKPVKNFMTKREEYYRNKAEESAKYLKSAEDKERDLNNRLDTIEEEILEKRRQADVEMKHEREQKLEETRLQCEKLLSDAKASGELERKHIIEGAREDVAQLAIEAVNKLMASDDANVLDQFLEKEQGEA